MECGRFSELSQFESPTFGFRRPNSGFANDLAGNQLQQSAEERAALWECAEAADCRRTSLIDTVDGQQLDVIAAAWSTLPSEVRAAIVAIVHAAIRANGPRVRGTL